MRPFSFLRRKTTTQPPPSQRRNDFEGSLPEQHDHVVRVNLAVHVDQEPDLRVGLGSRSWPFRKSDPLPEEREPKNHRYTTLIPIMGASLGATGEAISRLQHACRKVGVKISILSTARPRPRDTPTWRYRVVPIASEPHNRVQALYQGIVLRWQSPGYVRARSLEAAKAMLPAYLAENPGVGDQGKLTVTGRKGRTHEPRQGPLPSRGELLLLATFSAVTVLSLALVLTVFLPTGGSTPAGIGLLATLLGSFGVWLLLRRLPEGHVHVWLPIIVTSLIPILALAAGHLDIHIYMWQFGITPGDISIPSYNLALASVRSFFPIFCAAVIVLGIFGFGHHFHLGGRGHFRYLNWLLATIVVGLYIIITTQFVIERSSTSGARDIARYQAQGGPPAERAGIRPTPVCVDPTVTSGNRFGPTLSAHRPVLHFNGVDKTDVLWDRENGVTKVPSFSVTLTPVPDLDSPCPAGPGQAEPTSD